MDVQPPRDASLRNIIDKLAEFVARNGPEFEAITKQKQQNNPKFEFLYGGEFANYYQYRVAAEQQMLKQQGAGMPSGPLYMQQPPPNHVHYAPQQQQQQQQQQQPQQQSSDGAMQQSQHLWPPNTNATNPSNPQVTAAAANGTALTLNLTTQLEAIKMQQNTLREQIKQSDANLSAQHTALMTQKTKQIDDAMATAQTTQLEQLANEQGIVLREFDSVLQPIIESCTKDSISAGKNWILQHSTDSAKINVVLQYLLKKALVNGSTFQQKLHLIYLVNDILHHCMRKNISDLKNNLENVVIPMFCSADLIASSDQRTKLSKLLSLWESKAKFFDACVISKLQSPDSSMQEYKTNVQNTHHDIVAKYSQSTKATLDNYQKQHQIFMQHATQQIAQLEQQKLQLEKQLLVAQKPPPQQQQQQQQQVPPGTPQNKSIPALMSQRIAMPGADQEHMNTPPPPPNHDLSQPPVNNMYAGYQQQQQQQQQQPPQLPPQPGNHFVDARGPNFFIPDMSKPPPGFAAPPLHGQGPPQQQQQPPPPRNIPPMPGQVPGGEPIVDMGVLNAAIQAVMHLQHQQQQQQHQQQQRHPDEQPPMPQQQQHQSQQMQHPQQAQQPPPPFAQLPLGSLGQPVDGGVDIGALNAAINVVLQQRPDDQQQDLDDLKHRSLESGEPAMAPSQEPQVPTAPYYDLPAGLIVPLIRLEDYNYKPLDSTDIRLPAPAPQSERLTNALNAFYAAPSHDRPRDNEGWEKLGLYEYYKVKNAARKQKEEEIKNGTRTKSRSPSPIVLEKTKKSNKRCYRSKSRSRSRSRSPANRNRSRSRSKSRSIERALTPPPQRNRAVGAGGGGGSGSGGGSNRKARNRSPRHERDNSRENRAERNNSNSSNNNSNNSNNSSNNGAGASANNNSRRVERDRSPTPPSFFGSSFAKPQEFIEETNKGHQMLMKMGWAGTGTGLGSKNQGIDTPISGGEVRDRKDMYKGVGNNLNDPFERFRKNKGAAFAHRMSTRDYKT
ncbi:LOW QUALITY PROTEIN: calcium homeostasis endoplasmic reticulum protein [Drosophila sulfurigaster albostrigata]|uniref:LOW QUALITY PROTEIN: calcium homeostasis endoplasmic reticulum protein n=1 Tax=Drosophila sulfurigaster albostrigata TaxID=89887 RepID=UPI002D21D94A|nr:LOW QUALITY PROTEIN: calcium homeostasis endoplasmic reticulum protein [Drosophila sulfurigaster albostrigata]